MKKFIPVYKSRFTPNLIDGRDILFNKGETVTVDTDPPMNVVIDSGIMSHGDCEELGYEVKTLSVERFFIRGYDIINWKGKV